MRCHEFHLDAWFAGKRGTQLGLAARGKLPQAHKHHTGGSCDRHRLAEVGLHAMQRGEYIQLRFIEVYY
jgi:hypothetical protein